MFIACQQCLFFTDFKDSLWMSFPLSLYQPKLPLKVLVISTFSQHYRDQTFLCLCTDVDILCSVYKKGSLTTSQWDRVWAYCHLKRLCVTICEIHMRQSNFLLVTCERIVTWCEKMRPSLSLSAAYASLKMICLSRWKLLNCGSGRFSETVRRMWLNVRLSASVC